MTATLRDRRIWVITTFSVALLAVFWLGSRHPALNSKALMGGDTPLSGLAFDILVEILPGTGFWWQVAANAANWVYTNLNGMLFGIFFGG